MAGSVAVPTVAPLLGEKVFPPGLLYTMTASAPPAATSLSLLAKVQVPRSTSTILPAMEPAGNGDAVAHVVQRTEFGGVEEAPAALGVGGEEVAELRAAESKGGFLADGAEGAVLRGEAAKGLLPESGTRDGVDHQAGLIAELRARRAGDELHGLDGVERNLRGELL